MDSESKRMLRFIKNSESVKRGNFHFADFYNDYCERSNVPKYQVMANVRYLIDEGYISCIADQNGRKLGFKLEHKAYHKAYFTRKTIFSFLWKSVLVPIVVAVIGTIMTLMVLNIAKESLPQWLSDLLNQP